MFGVQGCGQEPAAEWALALGAAVGPAEPAALHGCVRTAVHVCSARQSAQPAVQPTAAGAAAGVSGLPASRHVSCHPWVSWPLPAQLNLGAICTTTCHMHQWVSAMMACSRVVLSAGGATPPPAFFEALASLKQLRVLEVLPGVYGQIAGYDMDVGQGDAGGPARRVRLLGSGCNLHWLLSCRCSFCDAVRVVRRHRRA